MVYSEVTHVIDLEFLDDAFPGGAVKPETIDAACVKIKSLVDQNKLLDAQEADRLLKDILLLAIADGRASNPEQCALHYFSVIRAAFGQPTLLDEIKKQKGCADV